VPVALAAGRAQQRLGQIGEDRLEGVTDGLVLGQDPRRAAGARPPADLVPEGQGPDDRPLIVDRPPHRDDIRGVRLKGGQPCGGRHRYRSYRRSKRSTGTTKTVAPPTSTSTGYGM